MEALTIWTEHALADLPALARLTRSVERSGIKIRIGHVPWVALLSAFVLGIVGAVIGAGPVPALFLMLIGLAAPFAVFRIAGARRRKAFDRQLPDVLATVASTLRAGHGLRVALRAVADDGSPPASEEFTRVLGEERLGRPLSEAMGAMCERVGSSDLDYVATAIDVQAQAGGSLASLFDTLSETVRERQRHARKVRALTSMGRMSAIILVTLPFGLAALMTLISPSYMAPLYETSTREAPDRLLRRSRWRSAGLLLKRIVNVRYCDGHLPDRGLGLPGLPRFPVDPAACRFGAMSAATRSAACAWARQAFVSAPPSPERRSVIVARVRAVPRRRPSVQLWRRIRTTTPSSAASPGLAHHAA